ncbi:hypothetical protein CY35_02G094100 [Sphagnum magellanicum]|nr:hypothetical protein CY35_02G094100 [Sphagnum magellanicum]KAH9571431.1 hypothetical protein CY35_02G094100 [Sphagnum magellanicum]
MKTVRRARTEAEVMGVAMDIEIGIGEMIVIVIETEVRGIDVTMKIVTEEIGVIETGGRSMSVIESEGTGIDQTTQHPKIILGIIVHVLGHPLGIGEENAPVVLIWHPLVPMLSQQQQYQLRNHLCLSRNVSAKACLYNMGVGHPFSGSMLNPHAGGLPSSAAGPGSGFSPLGQIPGMGNPMPGVFPSMFPFAGGTQATRHARRVYVGGLPPMANEQSVATFFSQVMAAVGANTAGPGDAVVNVYINQEKRFAFVEMRTVEEASNAMALDGIVYEGISVRVRRPSDYNPAMAATLGPSQPSGHLNLAAVGLTPGASGGADGPDRIFVGGLPYYLSEEQIIDLLASFGPLRGFDLVKDRDTGNSKGYGFCIYQDPSVMDIACAALNGLKMGDRTLTVRRASASFMGFSGQPKPDLANVLVQAQQQIALQKLALSASGANAMGLGSMGMSVPGMLSGLGASMMPNMLSGMDGVPFMEVPTKVVCLSQVVSPDELKEENTYEDILEDMREECGRYGNLINLVIPRPNPTGEEVPGIGMVFVEYEDLQGAAKAKASLHGRKFDRKTVIATYYPEEKFIHGDYGG